MVVSIVVTQLGRVCLGVVGAVQPPVLAGLLTGIVGLEFYTEMVAPCKLMVKGDTALKVQCAIAVQPFVQRAVDDGVAVCAVLAVAGTMAIAVAGREVSNNLDRLLHLEIVVSVKHEVLLPAPRLVAAEDIAPCGKAFAAGTAPVVGIAPGEGSVEVLFPVLVSVLGF